jgi:4-hydroxybenzoate polyprenyltransferase
LQSWVNLILLAPRMDAQRGRVFGKLRTLLILGRVSNLPTVWSNCLAGWLLGGGERWVEWIWLCVGGSALYVGGMFLNDAVDARFDARFRPERPIPAGAISARAVWLLAGGALVAGMGVLAAFGVQTTALALLLAATIVVYDMTHKAIGFAPLLMAACRFYLYLVAASVGDAGVTGWSVWGAVALASYVVGLSYVAQRESAPGPLRHGPLLLLAVPLVLGWIANDTYLRGSALVLIVLAGFWAVRSLRHLIGTAQPQAGRAVSELIAGIALVDLLAVAPEPYPLGLAFLALFGAALLFQRWVPAT